MTPLISLSLMVKNEQSTLRACLASVAGLVDEILVVDTGSTDRTKEVAAGLGARVVDFPWCDDFAASRLTGVSGAHAETYTYDKNGNRTMTGYATGAGNRLTND
jgi:glycosyltransferase involved in cell wall biosynthesis